MAGNIFQNDNCVIDDEACRDGQRHQREDVEAVAQKIHGAEGAENGDRHRDARYERCAEVAQKKVDDHSDQYDRHHQCQFRVAQRGANGGAAVDGDGHSHIRRHGRFQMWQFFLHIVDGFDDVRIRLAVKDDQDRRLAVRHAEIAQVLHGIFHVGDIRQAHRCAVAVGDHQRRVIGRHVRLVVCVNLITLVAVVDGTLRTIGIGRGERRTQVFEPNAVFIERLRVELDANRRKRRSADDDVADAAELRQTLRQDVARGVVHLTLSHRL